MDVCYPWIQPLNDAWDADGAEWGASYLDDIYQKINNPPVSSNLQFALGSVWPGYDDRSWSMGSGNWMNRQDTLVYEGTWKKLHDYSGSLPMPWCYIETWNDFNHGSEIEPGIEYNYKFIVLTRDHARLFKDNLPTDSVGVENLGLIAPQHIHQARLAANVYPDAAPKIQNQIHQALDFFFQGDYLEAISSADQAAGLVPPVVTIHTVDDSSVSISWTPDVISVGNVTEFSLDGLKPGSDYYIGVTAADAALGEYAYESWYYSIYSDADIKKIKTPGNPNTDVTESDTGIPRTFSLDQNYPNPFNPTTRIRYALPKNQHVLLKLYDIMGREIKVLVNEVQTAGTNTVELNAAALPTGVYFYRIMTDDYRAVRKMMLVK